MGLPHYFELFRELEHAARAKTDAGHQGLSITGEHASKVVKTEISEQSCPK
jgi:hypothetical protein